MAHDQTESGVLPLAYLLLPGADKQVYTRAFKILQNSLKDLPVEDNKAPLLPTRGNPEDKDKDEATLAAEKEARLRDLGPKTIIIDFELAQYNSFTKTFNGEVQGCFFHSRQAINRRLRGNSELGKLHRRETSGKCENAVLKFVALAF